MLIYNYQKEFLGIDEKDLKTLGFNSLSELRAEATDFADLFVKTPGHVHNFQHVHWIDFINYADSSEELKVLINVNAKTFKATLGVSTIFLIDNPTQPAYIIHLYNLRPLTKNEHENIANDLLKQEHPKVQPLEPKVFTPAQEVKPVTEDVYDMPQVAIQEPIKEEYSDAALNIPEEPKTEIEEKPLDIDAFSLDVFEEESTQEPVVKDTSTKKEVVTEKWDNGYEYDPQIASKELGLPLDLIEEFIQDFIAQAKEFKSSIYASIEEGDVDNVKILSHKLKGVAANLRIEDAHEVLSAVSATSDMDVIHENLDIFYKIIAKLAGEAVEEEYIVEEEVSKPIDALENDTIPLDLKDDEDEISIVIDDKKEIAEEKVTEEKKEDADTIDISFDNNDPQKTEMPELVNDEPLEIDLDDFSQTPEIAIAEESDVEDTIHFSKAEAAKEIGIDEASFNELFDDYIQESREILTKIEESLKNDDLQTCYNEALKLKGMSENMRVEQFMDELKTLLSSDDKNRMQKAIEKIDASINKISKTGV